LPYLQEGNMSDTFPTGSAFAAHVHEVVNLDEHGASLGAVEKSIESKATLDASR
jgi:hypothetical protein